MRSVSTDGLETRTIYEETAHLEANWSSRIVKCTTAQFDKRDVKEFLSCIDEEEQMWAW